MFLFGERDFDLLSHDLNRVAGGCKRQTNALCSFDGFDCVSLGHGVSGQEEQTSSIELHINIGVEFAGFQAEEEVIRTLLSVDSNTISRAGCVGKQLVARENSGGSRSARRHGRGCGGSSGGQRGGGLGRGGRGHRAGLGGGGRGGGRVTAGCAGVAVGLDLNESGARLLSLLDGLLKLLVVCDEVGFAGGGGVAQVDAWDVECLGRLLSQGHQIVFLALDLDYAGDVV